VGQIALTEKPLQVAVAGRRQSLCAQRGVAIVSSGVRLVALLTVIAKEFATGGDRLRIAAKRIGAVVVFRRGLLQPSGFRRRRDCGKVECKKDCETA